MTFSCDGTWRIAFDIWSTSAWLGVSHLSVHIPLGVLLQNLRTGVPVPDLRQLPRPPALTQRWHDIGRDEPLVPTTTASHRPPRSHCSYSTAEGSLAGGGEISSE